MHSDCFLDKHVLVILQTCDSIGPAEELSIHVYDTMSYSLLTLLFSVLFCDQFTQVYLFIYLF